MWSHVFHQTCQGCNSWKELFTKMATVAKVVVSDCSFLVGCVLWSFFQNTDVISTDIWAFPVEKLMKIQNHIIPRRCVDMTLDFNPRPDTVFRHLRPVRGGCDPLGVSKRSVVELRGKDQRIALAEYSRLVVFFWSYFGPIFHPVMAGQRSNCRKLQDFSTSRVRISNIIDRSGMRPSPACSPLNCAQNEVFWCISGEYLGRIVLIDDAVSHRWRHRSDLWRHGSVTWHANMIGMSTTDTLTAKEPFKSYPPPQETDIITNYVIWGKMWD